MCHVYVLATAPWCISSLLGDVFKLIPVSLKTDLKPTDVAEGKNESPAEKVPEEKTSLKEAEYRKQEVHTYEGGFGLKDSTAREETIMKMEIMQQTEKAKEEISVWYSEAHHVEVTGCADSYTPEEKKEMSLSSGCPTKAHPLTDQDATPPPEASRRLQKEVASPDVGVTSKKEADKKTHEERKFPPAQTQTRVTKSIQEDRMKSKKVVASKKPSALTEATHPAAESSSESTVKSPEAAKHLCHEDILPLGKPTLVSEHVLIKASRDGSPLIPAHIPSPEESPPTLSKAVIGLIEDLSLEEMTPPKKPFPAATAAPTKTSQAEQDIQLPSFPVRVKIPQSSSEEAKTTPTEPPPRGDDKEEMKGTQETEQHSLDAGT